MINKTLSERIAECKQDIIDAGLEPKYDIEFQIIEELLAENKIWQEMVDSTNQTNQALIKRLQENNEECIEPVSIKKETYRCAHDYVLKNQGYNSIDYLVRQYECSICGENKMTIQS